MNDAFVVHKLNTEGMFKARDIARAFDTLVGALTDAGVDYNPRLRAIVMTKLEEACFFAKKSMASSPAYHE